jgi:lauroyl/myristoyl acyltransferase
MVKNIENIEEQKGISREMALELAFPELQSRECILTIKENLIDILQSAIDTIILWSDPDNDIELIQNSLSDLTILRDLINNKKTYWSR